MAQRACRRAAAAVVRLEDVGADVAAAQRAALGGAGEGAAGAVHEAARGDDGQPELGRDLVVGEAVELAPQERVALELGQAGDVVEQGAQRAAALEDRGGTVGAVGDLRGALELDRVGAHPRALVQAAVACEPVQPRPQLEHARVALQRAVRAPQRLLHDVLDLVGGDVVQHPPREALERAAVAAIEHVPRAGISGAHPADELFVSHLQIFLVGIQPRGPSSKRTSDHVRRRAVPITRSFCGRYRYAITNPPGES